MSQQECEQQGCCWIPAEFEGAPHIDLPWCFQPNAGRSKYTVGDMQRKDDGSVHAALQISSRAQPELGADCEALSLEAEPVSNAILRIRITDSKAQRWEVPRWLLKSQLLPSGGSTKGGGRQARRAQPGLGRGPSAAAARKKAGAAAAQFQLKVNRDPFSFEVMRAEVARAAGGAEPAAHVDDKGAPSTAGVVFNTSGTRLMFKDQYLELSTWLSPSAKLFGAGERASQTLHLNRNGMPRTLWNRDAGPTFPEQNMYGSHPFVLALEKDGSAWGMLLLNSNAMDIVPTKDRLSWRVTGGMLDLFLLMGPTPLAVMDQLTALVGRPAMMPHWALGWHQCKYGYNSVWEVEAVVANYSAAGLPLEAIWTDIDHMDGWRDFTFHPQNFPLPEMQRFVEDLHQKGQRWVPIVDPGIKVDPGYPAYDEGLKQDVFIRGVDGKPYLAWVWPGACHFPDFFNLKAQDYFTHQLEQHHAMVPWDGMWIDMNEASNFCTGDICQLRSSPAPSAPPGGLSVAQLRDDPPWVCHLDCREPFNLNDTQRGWLKPPYDVSNNLARSPLGFKAMSVLATHYDGSVQYNTHQLYGLSECRVTAAAVEQVVGKRPFVLSRASYLGTGAYAGSWTGDNSATWSQLALSIPGILNLGLAGIPMAGADICGFQGDTTEELCTRWVSMGAFYPFSRDHSDLHSGYQELYRWPEVSKAGKKALGMRYRMLPYLYTALHTAHQTGAPVMRPLWMNFPRDANTHTIDRQFMVGNALLVSPVLEQGASSVEAYFPPGTWHSLWGSGEVITASVGGKRVKLDAPLGDIPLHMLGGSALVMQQEALLTSEVKNSPMTVVVALPEVLTPGSASAALDSEAHISTHMYNDGGEDLEVGDSPCNFLTINATFGYQPSSRSHAAEVLLQFCSPKHLLGGAFGGGCSSGALPTDSELGFRWPALAGVEVLGWHLPAASLVVDLLKRSDSCGGWATTERLSLPDGAAATTAAGLQIDLSVLNDPLNCPRTGLRVSWEAGVYIGTS